MKQQFRTRPDAIGTTISFLCLILGSINTTHAQDTLCIWEYPSAANLTARVLCAVDAIPHRYTYQYRVVNDPGSEQSVEGFFVDHAASLDSLWRPGLWLVGTSQNSSSVMWGIRAESARIRPSEEQHGFGILSPGLPSIAQFYVRGYRYIAPFDEGTPDIVIGGDVFENSFKGRTLAPRTPPARFIPLDFLDTLIAMKDEAKSLGWISPGSISTFIDVHFEKARNHLSGDDRSAAVEYVQDLRDEVSSAGCRHYPDPGGNLTTEACALLLFNIDYWLGQMRGG